MLHTYIFCMYMWYTNCIIQNPSSNQQRRLARLALWYLWAQFREKIAARRLCWKWRETGHELRPGVVGLWANYGRLPSARRIRPSIYVFPLIFIWNIVANDIACWVPSPTLLLTSWNLKRVKYICISVNWHPSYNCTNLIHYI